MALGAVRKVKGAERVGEEAGALGKAAVKQPWELTRAEYLSDPYPVPTKEGHTVLYHVTSPESLPGIQAQGLRGEMAIGGDSPAGFVWGTTSPKDYSTEQSLVAFQVPN